MRNSKFRTAYNYIALAKVNNYNSNSFFSNNVLKHGHWRNENRRSKRPRNRVAWESRLMGRIATKL